ncbi:MAG TPA: hypothetical protein PLT25_04410 [Acidocella sp.]|nr:hypothetical protein [Acidocella sp.]HQU03941.1 hypothetical protein [Acidocella sp.]
MKTRDFTAVSASSGKSRHVNRKSGGGPSLMVALLGAACVLGVFAGLALLYHVQ